MIALGRSKLPSWREVDIGFVAREPGSTVKAETTVWRTSRPVIDYDRCTACGWCWVYCPEPAIRLEDGRYIVDYQFCKGCGICGVECPLKCVAMVPEEE